MRDDEILEFTKMLDATCAMLSRGNYKPNAQSSLMFFRSLQRFDFKAVEEAFGAHISDPTRGKFPPVPADIIAQLEGRARDDGRPEADEAWAMAMRAQDEGATVVWTDETAEAWGAALPVLLAGDEVGARMAFRAAYSRLVDGARKFGRHVRWTASLGHNKAEQQQVIAQHVQLGRLPSSILELNAPAIGLLELATSPKAPEVARAAMLALRDKLAARALAPSFDELSKAQTDELKRETGARVAAYLEEQAA